MVETVCHLNYNDNAESKESNTQRKKKYPRVRILGAYRRRRHIYIKNASKSHRIYIIYIQTIS